MPQSPAQPPYRSELSTANRIARTLWALVRALAFRPTPTLFYPWRNLLLRLFGAHIARGARVYPSCRIWAPWNLRMADHSCLGPFVDCYNVAPISLGAHAIVSQYSHLCAATHDPDDPAFPLRTAPIAIGAQAWVCTDVFVGPGVTIADGCVVGARSSVFRDLPAWTICHGSPARPVRERRRQPANAA